MGQAALLDFEQNGIISRVNGINSFCVEHRQGGQGQKQGHRCIIQARSAGGGSEWVVAAETCKVVSFCILVYFEGKNRHLLMVLLGTFSALSVGSKNVAFLVVIFWLRERYFPL